MPVYALNDLVPVLPPPGRYWVAPDAHVIGRITLGEDVGVWFGAVIRADNEPMAIGARTNVQEAALLHSDTGSPLTVGEEVTVGHHAILHGCTVGDCTLIGMGATVLNRARIGRFSIVGANALVTEGREFPDYSLIVGSPAKVVRELPPSVADQLRASATHYVANWQRFQAGLRVVG
ncbi:gamma carbonic anhydrase family protein [Paracraurococcus ruber]|uniref:Gamma carbonic anhydrase family protein n=1 Tax=Paracraurococcus ruber TaxID=77675 RepID=A0ABS1D0Z2_9PROT|nr:gamma carbonic anhydrase family protein [Paracraurococcus ruber]MBK1660156.1 gamma carbonic anhydrase family protein [Paracraurococcus ruber]TDG26938.1 gamma carbonic anhydrase family protein [Paracraurococcus ruber]